jgi:predicted DNA-binding protein (MmcQ/YjbR family)
MPPRKDHGFFKELFAYCAAKPLAEEAHPWGETVFKIGGKLFVVLSDTDPARVTVKPNPAELEALLNLPFICRAAYVGRFGWVTVTIEDEDSLDVALRLVDQSYDAIAAKTRGRKRGKQATRKRNRER